MKYLCKKTYLSYFIFGEYYESELGRDNTINMIIDSNSWIHFKLDKNSKLYEYFYDENQIRKMKLKKLKIF
jgi:formaldehyde-activating enzyme involved in methanogenesis